MPSTTDASPPLRGWVYLADLDPAHGTEPGKTRPVLVLQTDLLNRTHPSTIVLPLTTNVRLDAKLLRVHFKKGEAGLSADSDAMVDQIRAIDGRRLKRALGVAPAKLLAQAERGVSVLLDFPGA